MRATIQPKDKGFSLMLGTREIGFSKSDTDARFHMHAINDALDVAFLEGQKYLERMVERERLEAEFQATMMQVKAEQTKEMIQQRQGRTAQNPEQTGPSNS